MTETGEKRHFKENESSYEAVVHDLPANVDQALVRLAENLEHYTVWSRTLPKDMGGEAYNSEAQAYKHTLVILGQQELAKLATEKGKRRATENKSR